MTAFDTAGTVLLLRRLAAASSGLVSLAPGIDDAAMDSWPVPVPEEIRVLFRAVGGVRFTVSRSAVNGHASYDQLDFAHPYNEGRYHGLDTNWYVEHAGGTGSHWFVHTDHGDGHTYVDVDAGTGAWGPVLRFWDATDTVRIAPSLPAWVHQVADCASRALAETSAGAGTAGTDTTATVTGVTGIELGPDGEATPAATRAFGSRFGEHWAALDDRPPTVGTLTVPEARAAADPVLREAAAGLPEDALLADLRAVTGPARVDFRLPVTCRYARRAGGGVLIATPWDGE
ncbi:hypothetical protein OH807_03505 [Kitasatospora sp. NBC_01560]|uniref:hypothetical protein n=1 Tax=Kitasatospora sp. NBC_01560 TaxID=2975965 RepID=UPI00386ECE08